MCDLKAQERFGVAEAVYGVRGAEHVRVFPPSWECPLTNGETESVGMFG